VGRDGEGYSGDLGAAASKNSEKQKYFCKGGWTRHNCKGELICPSGTLGHAAPAVHSSSLLESKRPGFPLLAVFEAAK
jgi:hypothetical protein